MSANLNDIPAQLQLLIQDKKEGILRASLYPELSFRQTAVPEELQIPIGNQLIKFRGNLLAPTFTPLTPGVFNSNTDNGLTPQSRQAEQFSLAPKLYGATMDLHKFNNITAVVKEYAENLVVLAQQAEATIDGIARNTLFQAYMSGRTYANATNGSQSTITVDDVTGFETVMVNGVPTAVSMGNPLVITIAGVANTVVGVDVDVSDVSRKVYGGRSGTLHLGTNSASTTGNIIISFDAPRMVLPYASGAERADILSILPGDKLTMKQLRATKTYLRNQNVRMIDGAYDVYLSADSQDQLLDDPDFKQAFQGTATEFYGQGTVTRLLDLRFITGNTHVTQESGTSPTEATLHFPIMCGEESLIEGKYVTVEDLNNETNGESLKLHKVDIVDEISFIERASLDRLGLSMAQSWSWSGDFTAPTDSLVTTAYLPTASNSRFKRSVVMAHSE